MNKPLLIEIGVEELPAIPFLKELPHIEKKWLNILEKYNLKAVFDFYYTPRRLVFWHNEFPLKQEDSSQEFFGAPLEIAYKDGNPTQAALGFAKKCGVGLEKLGKTKKNNRDILYYKKEVPGKESKALLGIMVESFLDSLEFGKSMRWADEQKSFIRPIRWIGCMLGDEHVPFELYSVKSAYFSYGHRGFGYEPFAYEVAGDYFEKLKERGVILFQDERKQIILQQMQDLEKKYDISIEKEEELLQEIVAITEYPTVLLGQYDNHFLTLPPEVIITSMKEHQRYFPVFKNGELTNQFVVVANSLCEDNSLVTEGNEKVLRARLSDALFFWNNDLKKGLHNEELKDIIYLESLGSLYDKMKREQRIGAYLAQKYLSLLKNETQSLKEQEILSLEERSIALAKADLLSEMVYEFTELQGLMGSYYAKMAKEHELLCLSLKEQYLPKSQDGALPSTVFSSIVALSNKLDSLMALFSIDAIPTGTKDPFGLRRAVVGLIKIVLKYDLVFNIKEDFKTLSSTYKAFDIVKLEEFIIERMYAYFEVNPSILKAVLASGERDIVKIAKKVDALYAISKGSYFKENFTTFKRVANIVKDIGTSKSLHIKNELFEEKAEEELFRAFEKVNNTTYHTYEEKLDALFGLKKYIDLFFDTVMVNAEDETIKQNRQNLIGSIYQAFKHIADIKEISV